MLPYEASNIFHVIVVQIFTAISPYAFCVFTEIPVNYSCIDGTTREHLPIAESVCETNRLTTEEPIYEIIP